MLLFLTLAWNPTVIWSFEENRFIPQPRVHINWLLFRPSLHIKPEKVDFESGVPYLDLGSYRYLAIWICIFADLDVWNFYFLQMPTCNFFPETSRCGLPKLNKTKVRNWSAKLYARSYQVILNRRRREVKRVWKERSWISQAKLNFSKGLSETRKLVQLVILSNQTQNSSLNPNITGTK